MRVVFFGTSAFAVPSLHALTAVASVEISAVYTQPPRQAGRGHKLTKSDVHGAAEALGLPVRSPAHLKGANPADDLAKLQPDLGLVASYGLLLPQAILDVPRFGCVNIHASLLPRWRGASPIQQAILAGDKMTGVDFFQMEKGLDTGPVMLREALSIEFDDTSVSLTDKLARLAASMVPRFVEGLEADTLTREPQSTDGACYAPKITKADATIDWDQTAARIERQLRAFMPWPGAWTTLNGERLRILSAEPVPEPGGAPGTVVAPPMTVACGEGALRIDELQRVGRKAMSSDALLRGFPIPVGSRLGS